MRTHILVELGFAASVLAAAAGILVPALSIAQVAASASATQPAPSADQWKAFALQDVQASYEIYKVQHPGMLDPANPTFPALLDRARTAGLEAAEKADSHRTYSLALATFSAELNDGHAQSFAKSLPAGQAPASPAEWPGFLPMWREGSLVVRDTTLMNEVPTGTRIVSCDGVPIREFLSQRLRTHYIRSREEGQFWARAPFAFYTTPTSTTRARACRIRTPDGAPERDLSITWSPAPEHWSKMAWFSILGDRRPTGITEPRPGIFHIALPNFMPDDKGRAAYETLFATMKREHPRLAKARAIVLDLRYNNGGSSSWGNRVAAHIWGEAEVRQAMSNYFAGTETWWRPTAANISAMQKYAEAARKRGDIKDAEEREAFLAELSQAKDRGEKFHVEKFSSIPLSSRQTSPRPTSFPAPVFVVTSPNCASACLDAVDVFTRFQGVTLIGAPTSGDSTYMDVRIDDLPSDHGQIVVPMKVYSNRPRGNGEIYQPQILMRGLDWSTEAFLDKIERNLGRGR